MTNSELLQIYIPMVDFLGNALGTNTEVVLNDLSRPASSVIAIKNGELSGRQVGSSLTDFALNIKNSGKYVDKNYAVHYKATANGKTFLSSSYYIKNSKNELIGMLCLNTDTTDAKDFIKTAQRFMEKMNFAALISTTEEKNSEENLNTPINSLVKLLIEKELAKYSIPPSRMTREEKIEIVQELSAQGVTSIKGSIAEIAQQLQLSDSTVYRYVNKK